MLSLAVFTVAAMLCADPRPAEDQQEVRLTLETAETAARHVAIAKARQGTILLAHRGAATIAPENTIESIRVALRLGCGAVKLDFRRTLDGVVVLYHDGRLEHRLNMFGTVETSYYDELRLASLRDGPPGRAGNAQIATLAEALEVLREEKGLVYIDVKTAGLSAIVLEAFRKAGMLDHIIGCGVSNSEAFRQAGISQIPFKGALLETHKDLDPDCIKDMLARPGQVVFLDDPRAALSVLGKKARSIVVATPEMTPPMRRISTLDREQAALQGRSSVLPVRVAAARIARQDRGLFAKLLLELAHSPTVKIRRTLVWNLRISSDFEPSDERARARFESFLLNILADSDPAIRADAAIACGRARMTGAGPQIVRLLDKDLGIAPKDAAERGAIIDARGHFAFALGLLGERTPETVDVLLKTFRQRETGKNRMWLGVDGAMAAWALGKLRLVEAVPLFRDVLLWQPPQGQEAADDDEPPRAYVYWDLQAPRFLPRALVEIGTPEAFAVLREILKLPPDQVGRGSPELLLHTAEALTHVAADIRPGRLVQLFSQGSSQARGEAILQCLREPRPEYRRLLEKHAAWALPWWDVGHGTQIKGTQR